MGKKLPETIYYEELRKIRDKAKEIGIKRYREKKEKREAGDKSIGWYWLGGEINRAYKELQDEILKELDCGKCPNSIRCTLTERFGKRRYINIRYGKARIKKNNIKNHYDCCIYSQAHSGDKYVNLWEGVKVESEIEDDY